jgi:hypothetical protein
MHYDYTASALGLGGVLKHPNGTRTTIPSLASVHLAPTGGDGETEISNYNKDGVSFSLARSSVFGAESGYRTFTSGSSVLVKDLNLFGRIQATRLYTSITSTRIVGDDETPIRSNPDHARFTMQSQIVDLRIDGIYVIPEFDVLLSDCLTYEEFTQRIRVNSEIYARQFDVAQGDLQNMIATNMQPIHGSFLKTLQHAATSQIGPRNGFRLPVKNFGYVDFGEMIVRPGRRRVNLLRIEFDMGLNFMGDAFSQAETMSFASTSTTGSMTLLSLDGNGAPSWP